MRATYSFAIPDVPDDLIVAVSRRWPELRFLLVCGLDDSRLYSFDVIAQGSVDGYDLPESILDKIWRAKYREQGIKNPEADDLDEDTASVAEYEIDEALMDAAQALGERLLTKGLGRVPKSKSPVPGGARAVTVDFEWTEARTLRELGVGHGLELVHKTAGTVAFIPGYPFVSKGQKR